jgi:hypothetical protein
MSLSCNSDLYNKYCHNNVQGKRSICHYLATMTYIINIIITMGKIRGQSTIILTQILIYTIKPRRVTTKLYPADFKVLYLN